MNRTVKLSLPESLLVQIDEIAQSESRSRCEFLRAAARMYIERKRRWDEIFALGDTMGRRVTPSVVEEEIAAHRKRQT